MSDDAKYDLGPDPAPQRPPYTMLLLCIRNHPMTYMLRMDEDEMDECIAEWDEARTNAELMTFETGPDGVWHIPGEDILFLKRITEAEVEEFRNMANRARAAALGGLR